MRAVSVVMIAVLLGSCGLMMTTGPDPSRPPHERPQCTESMRAPKQDAFGAIAGFGALMVGLLFLKADDNPDVGVPLMVGGGVIMAGSYASAGIGYFRVKRCREAITDYDRRMMQPAPLPGSMPMPQPAPLPPTAPQ